MPLTTAEKRRCESVLVEAVRQDIGIELAEYYGAAVFFGKNEKPEQPNNEIRNALNHFARAFECETWAEAEKNHASSRAHLERAKRDSLKLATIGLFGEIREILRNAEAWYGIIEPAILVRKSRLVDWRLDTYIKESSGHNGTTLHMLELFSEAREFHLELLDKYPAVSGERRRGIWLIRLRRGAVGMAIAFVLGAMSGVAGNYLYANLTTSTQIEKDTSKKQEAR